MKNKKPLVNSRTKRLHDTTFVMQGISEIINVVFSSLYSVGFCFTDYFLPVTVTFPLYLNCSNRHCRTRLSDFTFSTSRLRSLLRELTGFRPVAVSLRLLTALLRCGVVFVFSFVLSFCSEFLFSGFVLRFSSEFCSEFCSRVLFSGFCT